MQRIIYKNEDKSICVIAPADGCELSIEQIARKDVPAGTPYSIVDAADLAVGRGRDGKLYQAGEEPAEPAPTNGQLLAALRAARDARLTTTDKYLLADYPISTDNLALIKAYRADLRALPAQTGAPWDGGGKATPWPDAPEITQAAQPCA